MEDLAFAETRPLPGKKDNATDVVVFEEESVSLVDAKQ